MAWYNRENPGVQKVLIFMRIIHSNYSLNLGLHLVGTGLLNTVSLVFVPMNLAFKTSDLVSWIWGVLYRVYTKDMKDCLLGASFIIN